MWKSDLIGLEVNVNGARFRYELFYIVSRETSHDKNNSRFSTEFKTEIPRIRFNDIGFHLTFDIIRRRKQNKNIGNRWHCQVHEKKKREKLFHKIKKRGGRSCGP